MSDGLRKVWVCCDCDVRVRNISGRPIPEPAKWADERCPKCRVDLARVEGGKEAADTLEERLGLRHHRPGKGLSVDDRRKRVTQVVGEHPDWTNQQVAEEIGAAAQAVQGDRLALDLPRLGPGQKSRDPISDEQRAAVERELRETFDSDKAIAERAGVSIAAVAGTRQGLGILPSPQRRSRAQREAVAATLAAHPSWSDREVAGAVGLDVPVVRYHRRALADEVPLPEAPTVRRRKARRARVAAYVKEHPGASNRQVADALGEPFGTIRHDRFHMAREEEATIEEAVLAPA